jgi:signal transduction histidine kinase
LTARKVAHEINNPLGIISNYITSMKLKLPADNAIQGDLTIIDEEIHRMSSMIGQLDHFSKDRAVPVDSIDVNAVIKDIIHFVRSAHFTGANVTISFLPETTLPYINSSKDAIKQILLNLLKNAAEAMEEGGRIDVRTRQIVREKATGGDWIEIVVSDNGPGLPEQVKAKMFTPFVTTKQNGHSGLGLSIVHKIVTDLGGKLSCTSNHVEGTRFSIVLPTTRPDTMH